MLRLRNILTLAGLCAVLTSMGAASSKAETYLETPEYLMGQPLPVRACVCKPMSYYYADIDGPVKVRTGSYLLFAVFYYDQSLAPPQRPTGAICDADTYYAYEGSPPTYHMDTCEMLWDWNDGSAPQTQTFTTPSNINHTFTTPGLRTITWKVRDRYLDNGGNPRPSELDDDALTGAPEGWDASGQIQVEVITDTTPPTTPVVIDDGSVTVSTTTLHAKWSATDPESGVERYSYAIGTTRGGTNVVNWTNAGAATEITRTDLSLVAGTTYYFSVRATNYLWLTSSAGYSDGIKCSPTGAVVFVKPTGNDANDGSSWDLAKATVTAGISTAVSGQQIWVAAGTYNGQVSLKTGTLLYGGFEGNETADGQRDPSVHVTTLYGTGDSSTVRSIFNGAGTAIDGFTITHGGGNYGGGVYALSSTTTISNNVITNNVALLSGGGVYISGGAPTISGNAIIGNGNPTRGGGIYVYYSSANITRNTIQNNQANTSGAGIYVDYGGPRITSNIIKANMLTTSQYGAGVGIYSNGYPRIANNVIAQNTRQYPYGEGYGVWTNSGTVANNTIVGNWGGGVYYSIGTTQNPYGVCNNILADNGGPGWYSLEEPPVVERHNCYSGNEREPYMPGPGPSDITDDPQIAPDGMHLLAQSPCHNTGTNSVVQMTDLDVDGEWRRQDGVVDIGADEITGCIWRDVVLTVNNGFPQVGENVAVTACVTRQGVPIPNATVTFSATAPGSVLPLTDTTDSAGNAHTTLSSALAGNITVTATVTSECVPTVSGQTSVFYEYLPNDNDWPMFLHDAKHRGMAKPVDMTFGESLNDCTPNWYAACPAAQVAAFEYPMFDSSPVVSGGKVIIGAWQSSSQGYVRAFDGKTGSVLWTSDPMGGVASTPCVYGPRLYAASCDGYVYCLDPSTGETLWSYNVGSPVYSSLTGYGGRIYVMAYNGVLHALDADEGTEVTGWPLNPQLGYSVSSPAITTVNGKTYLLVGTNSPSFLRVNLSDNPPTCSDVMFYDDEGAVESSPCISGNYAFVGFTMIEVALQKVQIEPFQVVLSKQLGAEVRTSPVMWWDFYVYCGCDTGRWFYQIETGDMDIISTLTVGVDEYFIGSAACTNNPAMPGFVYVGNDNGNFYATQGTHVDWPMAIYQTGSMFTGSTNNRIRSSPAIAYIQDDQGNYDRWVYITSRTNGGTIFAFKTDMYSE